MNDYFADAFDAVHLEAVSENGEERKQLFIFRLVIFMTLRFLMSGQNSQKIVVVVGHATKPHVLFRRTYYFNLFSHLVQSTTN